MTSTSSQGPPLLIVAGEASGDLHAARLLSRLRRLVPEVDAFGMGGDELVAAGLDRVADSSVISVVGLFEALKVLPRAKRAFDRLLAEVERRSPAGEPLVAVLVDSPDFNLRLAKALKRRGHTVVYYISPQVWAWRRGRVKGIARTVDRMLVLFPFEAEFYAEHGVEAVHVGHPLVDEVPQLSGAWDERGAWSDGGEESRVERYRIALLPGSRSSEIDALLPTMLASVRALSARVPVSVRLIRARTIPRQRLEEAVAEAGLGAVAGGAGGVAGDCAARVPVEICDEDRFAAIADSHLALCASGTATLEVALLGTPMLVLYRLNPLTYAVAKHLVDLPHISLVNLVLGHGAVPELVQHDAEPENVAAEAAALLTSPLRLRAMRADLSQVRHRLGEGGGSAKAAGQVAEMLRGSSSGAST